VKLVKEENIQTGENNFNCFIQEAHFGEAFNNFELMISVKQYGGNLNVIEGNLGQK
jgi:hypothetical protein